MAYATSELKAVTAGMSRNWYNTWIYDTTDAVSTVRAANYITDATLKGMNIGDIVLCRTWTTSVRSGTLATFQWMAVLTISATTGAADLTDGTALTLTNT